MAKVNDLIINGINISEWILNHEHPVGSIYLSFNNTSPATLFGGTWESIVSGSNINKFLLCTKPENASGATGGEATHSLNVNEMPAHKHLFSGTFSTGVLGITTEREGTGETYGGYVNTKYRGTGDLVMNNTGGSVAHNNMPPYITVYAWKRTA